MGAKFYSSKTTQNPHEYEAGEFREIATEIHRVAPDKPIVLHAGDNNLEDFIGMVAGDLGHPLHVAHVNSSGSVGLVNDAKEKGLNVTCGVCPHHLFKTSHDVLTGGMFDLMMPPLVHQDDAEELFELLVDDEGGIDIIETDHAPHTREAKMHAETEGGECFGVPGIEFAIPLLLYQMSKDRISYKRLIEVTSTKPAEILGLKLDERTQVTWDLTRYRIESDDPNISGSGWSPFVGMMAGGRVSEMTVGPSRVIGDGKLIQPIRRAITKRGALV
jgi:dihydroorotase-like cyclic amidohydrolase